MKSARDVLISITGGKGLTLYDVDEAASRIRQEVAEEANIIIGATFEPALEDVMRVSVVATGIDQAANSQRSPTGRLREHQVGVDCGQKRFVHVLREEARRRSRERAPHPEGVASEACRFAALS